MNLSNFDFDMTNSVSSFVQSVTFLVVGIGLENIDEPRIPLIVMDIAKLLAYLGASVSFWKLLFGKEKSKKEE